MENLKSDRGSGSKRNKKHSLIRILYVYPIVFFLIGLSSIIAYYTFLQIHKYKQQVDRLKTEFPEKQRIELKSKVLLLKDYISWVKSHPREYILKQVNSKMNVAETLLRSYGITNDFSPGGFPKALSDSLDELNKASVLKIVFLDPKHSIIYPKIQESDKTGRLIARKARDSYNLTDFRFVDSLVPYSGRKQRSDKPYLSLRESTIKGIQTGIAFQPGQETAILQELVLDSLSKIKYANNEYVIINTYDGHALLAKGSKYISRIIINNDTETNWKAIFEKELEFAKQMEGGYYTYFWRNRPDVERSEKTSYFSGINDWEWIIGTGFFTSDVDPIIAQLREVLWKDISYHLIVFFVFMIILCLIAYFTMRYYAVKAESNILLFLHFFKRAAQGMQIIDSGKLAFSEFDALAQAANHMIQERERIKSVLSAEKSRLQYMIDAIPDLIFFKDTKSKFLGCNKAFEKYINKTSDEIIGLSEDDLFNAAEAKEYLESDKLIIQTLEPESTTNWVEYPNGQRCRFYTLKTPYFDSDNNLLGIIAISRDITEMEEIRQRLILAKEIAEESDRLKTAFLANMSHEIRTPMNAIIGFSDLLSDDDLSYEDKVDFISKIKNAGQALMALINDIIDIAKIESGQLKVTESACDINQILRDLQGIFGELKNTAGKRHLALNLILPEKSNQTIILTDSLRLQQILSNLLSNALKFTESGQIDFGYSIQDSRLSFFVTDTGIGIPDEKQELLFQRFSQIDSSTTRKYGGSGLGLAISKNLVELLGGTIRLESIPGKGSTFFFDIPYKAGINKPAISIKSELQPINWKGKTILIAEDIMQNYMLMEALLRRSEVRLLHALNGQIAIDLVRTEPDIDLVLMDIQLPIKTGYEALKEILEIRPGIQILSYTAFALPHERDKSLSAGFVDFIPKPIKAETLIPLLDKYLRNQGLKK